MAMENESSRLSGIIERIAIGAIAFVMVSLWNDQTRLEERVDRLQTNSFTVESAKALEDRLTKNIDAIRSDVKNETNSLRNEMNSKLDLLIKIQTEKK